MIESFLPKEVLDIELNGKRLHLSNEGFDRSKHFGKTILAEHVKKNKANIDLVGYRPLLDAISEAIAHFELLPK